MTGEEFGWGQPALARVVYRLLGAMGAGVFYAGDWIDSEFSGPRPAVKCPESFEHQIIEESERRLVVVRIPSPGFVEDATLVVEAAIHWELTNSRLDALRSVIALAERDVEAYWLRERNAYLEAEVIALDRAEHEARARSMRLSAILDAAPLIVFLRDSDGYVEFANRATETALGMDREDMSGRSIRVFEDDSSAESVLETGEVVSRREARGDDVYLAKHFPVVRPSGEIHGVCTVALDITEGERTKTALAQFESRYRALFHATADVILIYDPATLEIVDVNERIESAVGYRREDVLGKPVSMFSGMEESDAKPIVEVETGEVVEVEWPIRSATGDDLWFGIRMSGVELDGRALIVASGYDITHQKVEERRRHLLEEDILRSQKYDAVGRLAGGVAHDFNNLLAVILNYSDLIIRDLPQGELREDIQQIQEAASRAAQLTRQLLVLGRRDLSQPKAIDPNAQIENVRVLLSKSIGALIEFETDFDDVGSIWIDPGQFDQVLVNLTVNARDAMPEGGTYRISTHEITAEEALDNGFEEIPFVMISVEDTGEGMHPDSVAHVFEPFFTTKDVASGAGLGLGLAMVYSIVSGAEGQIRVHSELGVGTRFDIFLPLHAGGLDYESSVSNTSFITDSTVMIVEDEQAVLTSVRRILEGKGYTVIPVNDSTTAMDIALEYPAKIDLLLADVVMPGLSGPDLAERMLKEFPGIRVLFMSGYSDSILPLEDIISGRTDLLLKPFTTRALLETVANAIERSSPGDGGDVA